ncbi:hypothetical protein PV367_23385 [Streptomyces europaeiscabiei]|uniref:Uncharacterized protein n=1 Tax=Streptomyces europaeiscabiei TaxID=146819 RepID=A0AAJ2PS58_9ACTN|nr:hypothetical protein [Streptomyces europaeiscabiei]
MAASPQAIGTGDLLIRDHDLRLEYQEGQVRGRGLPDGEAGGGPDGGLARLAVCAAALDLDCLTGGHFRNEAAALKCIYMALMSLDPTGKGRQAADHALKSTPQRVPDRLRGPPDPKQQLTINNQGQPLN